jgi:hypothetical protein
MSNLPISQLPTVLTPSSTSDRIPLVDNGITSAISIDSLANYITTNYVTSLVNTLVNNAIGKLKLLGVNQTWTDVTASRKKDTVYTNTTGGPIVVMIINQFNKNESNDDAFTLYINDKRCGAFDVQGNGVGGGYSTHTAIIPANSTYKVTGSREVFYTWFELS